MTRPNALVGALAAVGVGTLLWLAWLIVAADLTLGTSIAAWGLWLLVLLAATTVVAYTRELGRHRRKAARPGSWHPLPGLVLLWIGGLTAVPVLALMLPQSHDAARAEAKPGSASLSAADTSTSASTSVSTGTPTSRGTPSKAARSLDRTSTKSPTSSSTPRVRTTSALSPTSTRSTSRPSTTTTTTPPTTPSATTTTPLIDITVLPNGHTKTKPPGR